jgi:hypothetical protein
MNLIEVYNQHKKELEDPNWEKNPYNTAWDVNQNATCAKLVISFKPKRTRQWIHCWEKYVPNDIKNYWSTLSPESKAAIYLTCEPIASNEIWD